MRLSVAAGLALAATVLAVPAAAQDYGHGHDRHYRAPRGYYGHGYARPYGYARHYGYGYRGYGYGHGGGRFACRYRFGERRCYRSY